MAWRPLRDHTCTRSEPGTQQALRERPHGTELLLGEETRCQSATPTAWGMAGPRGVGSLWREGQHRDSLVVLHTVNDVLFGTRAGGGAAGLVPRWRSLQHPDHLSLEPRAHAGVAGVHVVIDLGARTLTCHSHVGGTLGLGCPWAGVLAAQVLGSEPGLSHPTSGHPRVSRHCPGSLGQNHPRRQVPAPGATAADGSPPGSSPGCRWPGAEPPARQEALGQGLPGKHFLTHEGSKLRNVTATTLAPGDIYCLNARLHPRGSPRNPRGPWSPAGARRLPWPLLGQERGDQQRGQPEGGGQGWRPQGPRRLTLYSPSSVSSHVLSSCCSALPSASAAASP